jgi:hypothetical protein
LITKKVQIEFANSKIRAIDHIQDIRKAAESAGLNLYSRYDVQLQYPMPEGNNVVVEIRIPEKHADFTIGKHLRGISNYLLSKRGEYYRPYLVGNRLLNYSDVTEVAAPPKDEFSTSDRLEAIASFAKLLERSDEESLDQINRILVILDEAKRPWE